MAAGLASEHPESNAGWDAYLSPAVKEAQGEAREPLVVLSMAVGLVLLVTCANLANLLLVLSRQWLYVGLLGLSWAVSYGVTEALMAIRPGLDAVALGTDVGYLFFAVVLVVVCALLMEQPLSRALGMLARTLLPLGWGILCTAAMVFGLGRWLPVDSIGFALAAVVLISAAFVPMALPELRRLLSASR